ncbi:hypothetical protein LguiA_009490 [Lonicera macranthoides]
MAWDVRWKTSLSEEMHSSSEMQELSEPNVPTVDQGSRFSQAAAALHEFKFLCTGTGEEHSKLYWLGRVEEAKLLRAQGQHEMAINLAKYISQNYQLGEDASDVYRLVGKWLAETRSSNSRTILEKYLKHAVTLAEDHKAIDLKSIARQSQTHFHLAHYADALFRSSEERLNSNEWQAAMRLRKHKGEKTDYSVKIQELQKQLSMDREEAEKLQVQSYKFIPLVYQIASRMGSSKDGQGPHSFQLLALANGDRVKDKQRSRNSFVVDMDKKYAAENLLEELTSYHGAVIRQDMNKKVTLPREIRSVRQLELVPVVTATFPVDRSCKYHEGSFPHFKGLGDSITVMNGVNAPKVVECLGSDGSRYRQLAKSGNDDLRQDAVVPFTPSAGVLEWVNGTVPLGEYLIGSTRNGGAHGRYGVGDWTFLKCRQHMAAETKKRKAFQEVCQNFRPVMHYFFLERFLHPADWFEKRLAYTRSVAASSMVGYIVGLGDRHSMNILIDQATAEVVHIDLGVAFEQGLMLKTPERVPFRLTRDIIDGMGVTGVEGVFRRCCEETLSVMRTNKEALLTIIEEIDDDLETNLEDSQDEYEGNKDAARALLRVKQKLDGYEEGEMRSVHGQVFA